jgi:ATP-binding cassette subfamily B protein/subfamily B ATP-binding cassette protein MsbA
VKSLLRVLGYIRPYRGLAALTLLAAALVTTMELVPPWLVKRIIDEVIRGGNLALLPWLIGGLIGAYAARAVLNSTRIRFNNLLEQSVIHDMRDTLYRALHRMSVSYYESRATGEIMSRVVSDVNNVERIFIDGIEALVMAGLTVIGVMGVLFYLDWRLALVALVPIPFLVIGATLFTRYIHAMYHDIRQRAAQLNAILQDSLSGIRETMSFNQAPFEITRFARESRDYCRANLRVARAWSVYGPSMIILAATGTVLTLWFGAQAVVAGRTTLGELVAFLSYLALFYTPINQIHGINQMLQQALASGERVFEVLDTEPEIRDRPGAKAPAAKARGAVAFEAVSFNYRPGLPTLREVSFSVPPGRRVALVGPSGAGKSTIIKLLMRFYDVDRGAVQIDGQDIRDLTLAYLRDQIGMVFQEPFLFNGTVRDNLLYGRFDATEAEVMAAARAVRAHDFIAALPQGYDTHIGERGVKLSVGQKQRIAIARALLKDPPIIIFDEATSNIDTETEFYIQEALAALTRGRTTIIIAHRLSTIKNADAIIVIDAGRVAEQGTHDALLARGGLYAALYDAQFQT